MLVDYLRYVAFAGRLSRFFAGGLENYVDPSATTGQHLRFSLGDLDQRLRWHGHETIQSLYWDPHSRDLTLERLKYVMGLSGGSDVLAQPELSIDGAPATFSYKELDRPKLEIIIDVDPKRWSGRYLESQTYEDTPIVYRRAGPASGSALSGDKLVDGLRPQSQFGTICGFFATDNRASYALTCGHVVGAESKVLAAQPRLLWRFNVGTRLAEFGETRHHASCPPQRGFASHRMALDAALVSVDPSLMRGGLRSAASRATVKPISRILQEEPVRFRGASRPAHQLARVTAVTVRKSIDLHRDGTLYDVGDVLMLGHRHPMYIVTPVSRGGDSGAAVRQDFSSVGPFEQLNEWHGMILGSDETSAYATHAEHLWAWAAQQIGDSGIEFLYEI
jgi:hypothetical protein